MTGPPRVAVLLPAWNAADTIGDAVQSTLEQEGVTLRLVLVDDGSTDETVDCARTAARGDQRLFVHRVSHGGIVSALNAGLDVIGSLTAGDAPEFIARMDADDLMLPGRLQAQADHLSTHPELSLVGGRARLAPLPCPLAPETQRALARNTAGMQRYVDWLNAIRSADDVVREIFVEAPLCHPTVMFRTEALRAVGGYRDRGWAEDYDLWLRLHLAGHAMAVLDREVLVWRDHADRLTRTHAAYDARRFYPLKAHYLMERFGDRWQIWGAGRDGRRLARALEENGATIERFVDIDPRKIGGVRRGQVPVVGPDALGPPDPNVPLAAAVGIPRARDDIRQRLDARGWVEGTHFVCAA